MMGQANIWFEPHETLKQNKGFGLRNIFVFFRYVKQKKMLKTMKKKDMSKLKTPKIGVLEDISFNSNVENNHPLRKSRRINLNLNSEEYIIYLNFGKFLSKNHKIEGDPTKSSFYKDIIELFIMSSEYLQIIKNDLDNQQNILNEKYEKFRLKRLK